MEIAKLKIYNITRGNTYKEIFYFNEGDLPLDLTTYTAIEMNIRKGLTSNDTLLKSVDLTEGMVISGDDNNILTITIAKEDTAEWPAKDYYRDIKFTDSLGEEYTYCEGVVRVRENIT